MIKYYFDTCIWNNFFKKEVNPHTQIKYWKMVELFLEDIFISNNHLIYYSGFVLKELEYKLKNPKIFKIIKNFFQKEEKIVYIKADEKIYSFARDLESKFEYKISFFDCLHIAICKKNNFVLITRDNELLNYSKNIINDKKPENLII